jgi:hypothetical protein
MSGKGYTIKHEIYNLIIGILREAKSPMSTSGLFREAGLNCPKSPVPEYNQVSWMQGIVDEMEAKELIKDTRATLTGRHAYIINEEEVK